MSSIRRLQSRPLRSSRPHQSRSFAERSRRRIVLGLGAGLIALITWIFILSRISSLEYVSIETVQVYGADPDISPAIQAAASAALQGSYLGIFPKSDAFLYPRAAVASAALAASPRVISADVSRDGWHTIVISVSEKAPAALVCADLPNFDPDGSLSDDDDCYAADASGLIFRKMPAVPADAGAPVDRYYVPTLSDSSAIGSYATSTGEFVALQSFLAGVRGAGIVPEAVLMKDSGEYELYAGDYPPPAPSAATSSQDALVVIYFNDQSGLSSELADLAAFWAHMTSGASVGQPQGFQYIDLRYGANVFYR